MDTPIVVVIGAGSYVFGPSILYDLIMEHRMDGSEIRLVDLDEEMVEVMGRIAERFAHEADVPVNITWTTDRKQALPDADFVVTSVAIELLKRWRMDHEIITKHGLKEYLSECGGIGGLSYALRSIPLILGICRDMEELCPEAWLLNISNPLPRIMTAVRDYTSISGIGFCYVGLSGQRLVAEMLDMDINDIEFTAAGLNHFSWFTKIVHRQTGQDLYPEIRARVDSPVLANRPLTRHYLIKYGYLAASGDSHIGEYMPFDSRYSKVLTAHHGSSEERHERLQLLRKVAEGKENWGPILKGRAWERPADFINAISRQTSWAFDMLNVPNDGYITNLPQGAIVEVPVMVEDNRVKGKSVGDLPEEVAALCQRVSSVHELVAKAAVQGDLQLARDAISLDWAVADKEAGFKALDELLIMHQDVLPQFR